MSLLDALLSRGDPVEGRGITPQQWDRGEYGTDYYGPAGVNIDRDSILGLSAVWACVSLISDSIATLPLGTFKTVGGAPQATTFPSWMQEPNPEQTLVDFVFGAVASMLLHGNAYVYTVRDAKLNIIEAWLLDPRWVYVRREFQTDGSLALNYYVMVGKGMQSPVGPFKVTAGPDMFHVMAFQPNSSWPMGISPLDNARMMWGGAIAGQEMATRWFSEGFNASGVLEIAEDLTSEQARQVKEDFRQANTGSPQRMHLPPVLAGGLQWKQIQISPEQAQFLQQRQFGVDEIARWFRVPPHMIGNLEKTSSWGAGIEQQSIGFVTYTLRPWIARLERSWTDNLLTFQPGQFFQFDTTDLLRGDMAAMAQFGSLLHGFGGMNANEFRGKYLGLPPFEGGDQHYFQVNTAPVGTEPIRINKPPVDIPGAEVQAPAANAAPAEGNSLTLKFPPPVVNVDVQPQAVHVPENRGLAETAEHLKDAVVRLADTTDQTWARLDRLDTETRQALDVYGVKTDAQIAELRAAASKRSLRKIKLPDGTEALMLKDGSERLLELPDGRRITISDLNGDKTHG